MKKFFIIFVLGFITLSFGAFGQIKVDSNGNIGIDADNLENRFSFGTVGNTISKIYVFNSNASSNKKGLKACQTHPDRMLSIDNVGLIPVLVEAMKEQLAQIDELKKQINE